MRILMLLSKDYYTDPRVTKEAKTLADQHTVIVSYMNRDKAHSNLGLVRSFRGFYHEMLFEQRLNEYDVIHAHDLDTLPLGLLISRLKGIPLVYDAHESYADMVQDKVPAFATRLLRRLEAYCVRRSSKVITANRQIAYLVSEHPDECKVVMNCPELNLNPTAPRNGYHLRLGYFGSLEPDRFILEAIEAVKQVPEWGMVIGGSGSLEPDIIKALDGNERIAFLGRMTLDQAYSTQALCDLQLIMFNDNNANNRIGTPNRLFEAMSLGKPVVANTFTESGQIVKDTDCGFTCSYDFSPFKLLLEYLSNNGPALEEKGVNGLMAHLEKYNWGDQERMLLNVYEELKA